ncbi:MAG TPA: flavin reductase [Geobacterales bacterium]|nr:flavin reductase [Geobacterales bacterium]
MTATKLDHPSKWWDRLFAPSSCLAVITTVDRAGQINAASYGTCTRVKHEPVYIAFTANIGSDTAQNVLDTSEFVVNLPRFDKESLERVRIVGLPFAHGVNELEKAGFTALPSTVVKPPAFWNAHGTLSAGSNGPRSGQAGLWSLASSSRLRSTPIALTRKDMFFGNK